LPCQRIVWGNPCALSNPYRSLSFSPFPPPLWVFERVLNIKTASRCCPVVVLSHSPFGSFAEPVGFRREKRSEIIEVHPPRLWYAKAPSFSTSSLSSFFRVPPNRGAEHFSSPEPDPVRTDCASGLLRQYRSLCVPQVSPSDVICRGAGAVAGS